MSTEHVVRESPAGGSPDQLSEWEGLLLSMCNMLSSVSPTAMTSISMTGTLRGVDGGAKSLADLCRRFADEHGFRQIVQVEGDTCTVRFSRRDGRRPVLRRRLGTSI